MEGLSGVRVVPARNRQNIRKYTYQLRCALGLKDTEFFPIMEVLELVIPTIIPDFQVVPVEDESLRGRMAEMLPGECAIKVKQSVYDAACLGHKWARMVMAHELGHFLLHRDAPLSFAYIEKGQRLPDEVNPERQADIFAAELLAPVHLIKGYNEYQISKHFGVSKASAKIQLGQAKRIDKRHHAKKRKNGQVSTT